MGYQDEYKPHAHNRTPSKQHAVTANHARRLSIAYKPPPPPLLSRRIVKRLPLLGLVAIGLLLVYAYGHINIPLWQSGSQYRSLSEVYNATLGFERVFVINLAKRTDKRDSMTLAAAFTGIRVDYVDGVNGSTVEVPNPDPDEEIHLRSAQIGCWRSHLNILEKIVSEGISSALIMEDDADWDIHLKSQLSQFAQATQILSQPRSQGSRSYIDPTFPFPDPTGVDPTVEISLHHGPSVAEPTFSPYGDAWDLLWVGHCGTRFPTHETDPVSSRGRVLAYNDPTVIQPHYFAKEWGSEDFVNSGYPNHTRVYHHTSMNVCTLAYAVSQAGARRILYDAGVVKTDRPIDLMLRAYCDGEDGRRGGRACFTVQPQLFQHYRPKGSTKRFSDISNSTGHGYNDREVTFNIRSSMRMNLEKMLEGETDFLDQYPNV